MTKTQNRVLAYIYYIKNSREFLAHSAAIIFLQQMNANNALHVNLFKLVITMDFFQDSQSPLPHLVTH